MLVPSHENYQYLLFSLDDQRFVVSVGAVERVVRAVRITPLPDAPDWLDGVITLGGRAVPVVNLRRRFRLPGKSLDLRDRIMICRTRRRVIAFVVDQAHEVVSLPPEMREEAQSIFPELENFIAGAGRLADETVLIYDFDKLLTPREYERLETALAQFGEASF